MGTSSSTACAESPPHHQPGGNGASAARSGVIELGGSVNGLVGIFTEKLSHDVSQCVLEATPLRASLDEKVQAKTSILHAY